MSDAPKLNWLQRWLLAFASIRVVRLQRGDVLVIEHPRRVSNDAARYCQVAIQRAIGFRVPVLFVEDGAKAHVIRPDAP